MMNSGCSNNDKIKLVKKKVHISNFKKAILGRGITTDIRIIKTYPNEYPCASNKFSANLYICENVENKDTLYVFDLCGKVPYFAKTDADATVVIDHENIKSNTPKEVIVNVPETFSIPLNSRYIFSSLTSLEY